MNAGTSASQADDRIVCNGATGALFDAYGARGVAALQFATPGTWLALTSAGFLMS